MYMSQSLKTIKSVTIRKVLFQTK